MYIVYENSRIKTLEISAEKIVGGCMLPQLYPILKGDMSNEFLISFFIPNKLNGFQSIILSKSRSVMLKS